MSKTTTTKTTSTTSTASERPDPRQYRDRTGEPDLVEYPSYWAATEARLERKRQHLAPLWEMTVEQRIAAMRRGELTMTQLFAWASRHPEQVPLIDGEFEFIAAFTPEVAEADD
jgi:hypothetical protein